MRRLLTTCAIVVCLASCTSASPTFSLTGASVDPTYWCPGGANNASYDLHGAITARNGTGKTVTIDSVSALLVLASVTGTWLEKVGDRYDAAKVAFSPSDVAPGSSATLEVTIPSACTSGSYAAATSSSADYQVTMRVTTSAGAFSITAANRHEILAA
jgi:hypothetical protein